MAIPTEVKNLLEAAITQVGNQVNETAEERDFSSWSSEMLLKKAESILVGMIDVEIFKEEDRLAEVFASSMMLETVRESVKSLRSQNTGGSSSEPQHQQQIDTNSEESKLPKAENHTSPASTDISKSHIKNVVKSNSQLLTAYCQSHFGDSPKSQKLPPKNSGPKEVPSNAPMKRPLDRSAYKLAKDEKTAHAVPSSTTEADNTVYIERSSSHQYTTLSSPQPPKYGATEYTDKSHLTDGRTLEDREDEGALAIPTTEKTDNSKTKKKRKKKVKKIIPKDATEEMVPAPIAAYIQPITLPGYFMSNSPTNFHRLESFVDIISKGMQDGTFDLDSKSGQITALAPLVIDDNAHQQLQCQKVIEELKAEHRKSLADLTRKYEAIKFENRNLKSDRNEELERLRKEHSSVDKAASDHTEELKRLMFRIDTLESEVSEKCDLLEGYGEAVKQLRAFVGGNSDELRAIKNYRPDLEAHMAIFDAKKTSITIEENHAEGLSFKRHEHHSKDPATTTPKVTANNPLLSNEGAKICVMIRDLQKDNAELRARCQWYWDLIQTSNKTKQGHSDMQESVAEFRFRAIKAEDRLKEVETDWYKEKEWEKKRLLFDVGVAVRKRFFEQSKAILPHRKDQEGPDYRIIREGNEACHRGDAIADAALFELGLLSGADNIIAYHDLYLCDLHQIHKSPQEFTKAIGYWASIATIEATTASERHRIEALECLTSIMGLWNNASTAEEFKTSFVGNNSLYHLRELSRSIIRIDRGNKYRGYIVEKVDSGDVNNLEQSDGTEWD
ncbi:hypothetical protein EYC80_002508 [Monilinia laxa]|uniref:Uncharacterized protein n=1 Tax=Monilinia laxa TaxID=61186 RepID=A0A5N6K4T4_MONLA|nr:hypothetical protein EYC80_002508 [Monilinia laxa]